MRAGSSNYTAPAATIYIYDLDTNELGVAPQDTAAVRAVVYDCDGCNAVTADRVAYLTRDETDGDADVTMISGDLGATWHAYASEVGVAIVDRARASRCAGGAPPQLCTPSP